jgi:hypothetical protein
MAWQWHVVQVQEQHLPWLPKSVHCPVQRVADLSRRVQGAGWLNLLERTGEKSKKQPMHKELTHVYKIAQKPT